MTTEGKIKGGIGIMGERIPKNKRGDTITSQKCLQGKKMGDI